LAGSRSSTRHRSCQRNVPLALPSMATVGIFRRVGSRFPPATLGPGRHWPWQGRARARGTGHASATYRSPCRRWLEAAQSCRLTLHRSPDLLAVTYHAGASQRFFGVVGAQPRRRFSSGTQQYPNRHREAIPKVRRRYQHRHRGPVPAPDAVMRSAGATGRSWRRCGRPAQRPDHVV
jgi:hypothetical protein